MKDILSVYFEVSGISDTEFGRIITIIDVMQRRKTIRTWSDMPKIRFKYINLTIYSVSVENQTHVLSYTAFINYELKSNAIIWYGSPLPYLLIYNKLVIKYSQDYKYMSNKFNKNRFLNKYRNELFKKDIDASFIKVKKKGVFFDKYQNILKKRIK